MLLPPEGVSELRHCCRPDSNRATSACAVLYRSNRHLHHRLANAHCCAWQSKEYAGERATSAFNDPNASSSLRKNRARDATALARPLPRYVTSKAGFEPALPGTKYPKSSPPALLGERSSADWPYGRRFTDDASAVFTTQTKLQNEYCRGALEYGAPPSEP